MNAPLPLNEVERLRALDGYRILDTPAELAFDHLTSLAANHFQVPFAALTFIDEERQWFKSCVGADVQITDRKASFCSYTILSDEVMVVPNTLRDPRFKNNPYVRGSMHIRSYAGAPLRTLKGQNLGSFCILDTKPRRYSPAQRQMLEHFSTVAVDGLELRRKAFLLHASERKRANDLAESQIEILQRLARAAEFRDDETGQHTHRVAAIATQIAQILKMRKRQIELLRQSAPLHDVGKIAIPDMLLLKPGKLTPEEFGAMKTHTTIGAALLSNGHSPVVKMAERIARSHHERWDGTGYPQGLSGQSIPIEARILAVADVFDALTHERPYKTAWPVAEAVAEIARQAGRQFDPEVVEAFLTLDHENLL